MRIKLNRGPLKNKRYEIQDSSCREYIVAEPIKMNWMTMNEYPMYGMQPRRGSYMKSNVRLKDGTWVFEWMGWRD